MQRGTKSCFDGRHTVPSMEAHIVRDSDVRDNDRYFALS
jgi:hypothetical protein